MVKITLYDALKNRHYKIDKNIKKSISSRELIFSGVRILEVISNSKNFSKLDYELMRYDSKIKPRFDYVVIREVDTGNIYRYSISKVNETYYVLSI